MPLILLILVAISGPRVSGVTHIVDHVDKIELNHKLDEEGGEGFTQLIFWEWSHEYSRYHVVHWKLLDSNMPSRVRFGKHNGRWEAEWFDPDAKKFRLVRARFGETTWTTKDPERENKDLFPDEFRRGLTPAK